ncbi:unnamed protein product [Nyctereutes procyonoides]|uniref:(raccoon dog) hypothetical protein n=1 Tax=Nyctereutes procyonoides TaxID=34880 RepID=A0A811ZAD5_NYCPR|nr:unnamed protein product [Nyctereutes procyonoides]
MAREPHAGTSHCKLCLNIRVENSGDRLTRRDSQVGCAIRSFGTRRNETMAIHCRAKVEGIPDKDLKRIDLGIRYYASIGMYSLDFYGAPRVQDGLHRARHRISKDEARCWFLQKYYGIILPGK